VQVTTFVGLDIMLTLKKECDQIDNIKPIFNINMETVISEGPPGKGPHVSHEL